MLCLLDANRPCVPLCALVWQGSWLPHLLFGSALKLISGEMPERERERDSIDLRCTALRITVTVTQLIKDAVVQACSS